jgi:hypothetical protein
MAKNWIIKKLHVFLGINLIHAQLDRQSSELDKLKKIIKERTEYHLDVHHYAKKNSQVILIGKYHNRDFVKCYNIPDQDLNSLIDHCRKLEKYANIKRVDAMPEFTACIKNEFKF